MNTINIKTWNVNWFRGIKSDSKYKEEDQSEDCYKDIVINIKTFLNKKNSIVILQEVPYKIKKGRTWEYNEYYKKLSEEFPENEYDIASNINENNFIVRMTVAIFKKGLFEIITECKPCNNRTIGLKFDNMIILGVHMPTGFKENDDENKMWNDLIDYASKCKEENIKLIIAGDFNAFDGCEIELTENRYKELCKSSKDLVPCDSTFIRGTAIDHILINYNTNRILNVEIQDECKCSDHKYIEIELEI